MRAGADGKDAGKSEAEHRPLWEEESPTLGLPRRGKAPPVDSFSGESPDMLFEDWLPTLQRAAEWNRWSQRETLIQLAGHLRGRALQEWGLLSALEKSSLEEATAAMRNRLDPSSRAMAAQDFRQAPQHKGESVSDFIRRVEQLFKLAYGKDGMSEETRGTLLHGQLQEGLIYDIMKAPAVSGCRGYKELCLAARNEEKRLIELAKRQQYHSHATPSSNPDYSLHRRPGKQQSKPNVVRTHHRLPNGKWTEVQDSLNPCVYCPTRVL